MSATNRRIREATSVEVNHVGTKVQRTSTESKLERLVLACMLFENQFYIDGQSSAELVKNLVSNADPKFVADLALRARTDFNLRHIPLLLMRELARKGKLSAADLAAVIKRPDELGEFVSMYWADRKQPLSNQVKKGLATALSSFNEYSLAKWDKNSAAIRLRDVMFLTHPKPQNAEQEALFKRIADDKLVTPDTWEVALSGGADKKEAFTRLLKERKLGALAFIRNLRNMSESGVNSGLIYAYSETVDVSKVLPFRFIAAARQVPGYANMLEQMMFRALNGLAKLPGKTRLIVDVSGSMFGAKVSEKSDLERFDAAAALAVLCREICEEVEIFSFSTNAVRVNGGARGFALIEAIRNSQPHGGTNLGISMRDINRVSAAGMRDIVFTDEQSYDRPADPAGQYGYIINVASYQNGIANDSWTTITGFSEAVISYIKAVEAYSF